jgi:hypothetical protein
MRYVPEVVASFPAYDVIKPRICTLTDLPVFKDGDVVALEKPRFYRMFTFGSVVSFSINSNDDPIKSYNDAVERGHDLHWLNSNCVSISSNSVAKETYYEIKIDDEILFEGIVFKVAKDWNDNLKLVKVSTKDEVIYSNNKASY